MCLCRCPTELLHLYISGQAIVVLVCVFVKTCLCHILTVCLFLCFATRIPHLCVEVCLLWCGQNVSRPACFVRTMPGLCWPRCVSCGKFGPRTEFSRCATCGRPACHLRCFQDGQCPGHQSPFVPTYWSIENPQIHGMWHGGNLFLPGVEPDPEG